ncbi:MAG TPA: M28 family peptidase [Gemmatimonadaceae bacterium]|nr:M28 family peptidase [Gemmatimonadaceae bacterium]
MMRITTLISLCLAAAPALAQSTAAPAPITPNEIDGHLRFLSSDLLEGRAPATRGGRLAAEYIAAQLRVFGVEPGVNGSYFQKVPIDVVAATRSTIRAVATNRGARAGASDLPPASPPLRYPEDVVVWAGSAVETSTASGELVFVGYGSTAPEYKWDDFKAADVRGKVLLILVNDPPAPRNEPDLFGGRAMTYYGRWTYKFEEAERRGAAGALIIHTTERAGYPWHTVVGSWAKEQRMLPRDPKLPAPLGVRGWITDSTATALLAQAGLDLAQLRSQAESRDFAPVATGITVDIAFRNTVEHLESDNVVGIVRGRDPVLRDQFVAFSSHWDHLGVGPAVDGDSIYNGALDNASGVADLLAVARVAQQSSPRPRRSLLFVFVTAEESGLLGSEFFGQNPTAPVDKIVANINVDGGNILGRVRDLTVLGSNKSSLGPALARMLGTRGMRITPEEHPERGYFYRSDHFSFAKVGIPSISIGAGTDYIGRPKGWGVEQNEDYTAKRYHQPSDAYRPDFDLTGAAQLAEIILRFGASVANSTTVPTWNPDAEFREVREKSLRASL